MRAVYFVFGDEAEYFAYKMLNCSNTILSDPITGRHNEYNHKDQYHVELNSEDRKKAIFWLSQALMAVFNFPRYKQLKSAKKTDMMDDLSLFRQLIRTKEGISPFQTTIKTEGDRFDTTHHISVSCRSDLDDKTAITVLKKELSLDLWVWERRLLLQADAPLIIMGLRRCRTTLFSNLPTDPIDVTKLIALEIKKGMEAYMGQIDEELSSRKAPAK